MPSPISGHRAPGYRFRIRIRPLYHDNLYLPLPMKRLPEIKDLLDGASPLEVFGVSSLISARSAFCRLRLRYDFPFWAATSYRIHDINAPSNIVFLRLNDHQNRIIDAFMKRSFDRLPPVYFICKSFGPCGLTTCVQAYILWLQEYNSGSSITWNSKEELIPLRNNLRLFHNGRAYASESEVFVPNSNRVAFFTPYDHSHVLRNCHQDIKYVHLADTAEWVDEPCFSPTTEINLHWWEQNEYAPLSLYVMEGSLPDPSVFPARQLKDFFRKNHYHQNMMSKYNVNSMFFNNLCYVREEHLLIDLDL